MRKITTEIMKSYRYYLVDEEKAAATINKYLHDIDEFQAWLGAQELCKRRFLLIRHISVSSTPPPVLMPRFHRSIAFSTLWSGTI